MAKKKVVKPTGWEQSQIDKKLAKKYPHMAKESWAKKLKKKVQKQLAKRRGSKSYQLGKSGMSRKEVERLGGK
jgi:hypothetical protein